MAQRIANRAYPTQCHRLSHLSESEIPLLLEATQNEINQDKMKLAQAKFGFALTSANRATLDSWRQIQRDKISNSQERLKGLEEKRAEIKSCIDVLADTVVGRIQKNNRDPFPFVTKGRIGSALAALGKLGEAHEHFDKAARQCEEMGLDLESAHFRLQKILATPDEDLETKAKQLEFFFEEADREVDLRSAAPEIFGIWLQTRGETESWRILRTEALGALLELFSKRSVPFQETKALLLTHHLLQFIQKGSEQGLSEMETLALLNALQNAMLNQVTQGSHLGEQAKYDALKKLSQKMEEVYDGAARLVRWHKNHPEMDEVLGILEGLTYFHFWQQAGLPTHAVFHYWNHLQKSEPSEAKEALKIKIKEKAPHFFDANGNLLAKESIPLPKDSKEAAFAEESLHGDEASLSEDLLVGGGASVAGATVLVKLAGLASCGFFVELCVPAAAFLGGVGGYIGGSKITDARHAKEREQFVNDVKLAGLPLARLTLEEATQNEMRRSLLSLGSLGIAGLVSQGAAGFGSKILNGLGWFANRATWKYVGRQILYEGHYSIQWLKALHTGIKGMIHGVKTTTGSARNPVLVSNPTPTFEEVWGLLPPWKQARGRDYWKSVWNDMTRANENHVAHVAAESGGVQGATPFLDTLLGPLNQVWDSSVGKATRFGSNRLAVLRHKVVADLPNVFASNPLIAKKELLRAAYLTDKGMDLQVLNGNGTVKWPAFERFVRSLEHHLGTPELRKAHRLGLFPTLAGLFYDSDGNKGGGWGWDGELDSAWEFWSFFAWTNSLGKSLFDISIIGADVAGAINLYTIHKMEDFHHYEGDTNYERFRGAHLHYLTTTAMASTFISGLHYLRRSPSGQFLGSLPFTRRLPSMTSFPSAFRTRSTIDKPNFFTLEGWALTLLYQSYVIGYQVSDIFSHRKLINADPYYRSQRGTKYAVVIPPVNALQTLFGYRSGLGQTVGRLSGIPGDLALAKVFPPFLNKALHEGKERRLLDEGTPKALVEAWDLFTDVNTSLDLGGVIGRVPNIKNPRPKPLRIGHWRWESRGIETWTSPLPLKALDGRRGLIERLLDAKDFKKIQALLETYRIQFFDPKAPWHQEDDDQRGMMVFAFIVKYFAGKAAKSEWRYLPFLEFTKQSGLAHFFDKLPTPQSHEELLSFVTQVDEGKFISLLQMNAPNPHPPRKGSTGEPKEFVHQGENGL